MRRKYKSHEQRLVLGLLVLVMLSAAGAAVMLLVKNPLFLLLIPLVGIAYLIGWVTLRWVL